jgi:hypothetical protein
VPLIIGMVGALLILDDIDDRTVLLLRVSPVTVPLLPRLPNDRGRRRNPAQARCRGPRLRPRARHLSSVLPALALAAAQAPLITLTTAAVARNKFEGLAGLKILGLLPTGIAPAMWWLPDQAQWPLRDLVGLVTLHDLLGQLLPIENTQDTGERRLS